KTNTKEQAFLLPCFKFCLGAAFMITLPDFLILLRHFLLYKAEFLYILCLQTPLIVLPYCKNHLLANFGTAQGFKRANMKKHRLARRSFDKTKTFIVLPFFDMTLLSYIYLLSFHKCILFDFNDY